MICGHFTPHICGVYFNEKKPQNLKDKERKDLNISKYSHLLQMCVSQQSSLFTTSVSPTSHHGRFMRGHLTGLHFTLMVSLSHMHSEHLLFQVSPTCSSDGATLAPPETHCADDWRLQRLPSWVCRWDRCNLGQFRQTCQAMSDKLTVFHLWFFIGDSETFLQEATQTSLVGLDRSFPLGQKHPSLSTLHLVWL